MALTTNNDVVTALGGTLSSANQAVVDLVRLRAEKLVKNYVGYAIEQATFTEYYPAREQAQIREPLIEGWEMAGGRAVAYGNEVSTNRLLYLKNLPVRSITSLYENPSAWDTAGGLWVAGDLLSEGTDYQPDFDSSGLSWSGMVFRRSGAWTEAPRAIKVTYVGGLTSAELAADGAYPEFGLAALLTVVKAFNTFKAQQGYAAGNGGVGAVTGERLADWSISYADAVKITGLMQSLPVEAMQILEERVGYRKYLPM